MFTPIYVDEDPQTFHSRDFSDTPLLNGGAMWVPRLTVAKTLVLGSSQPEAAIDTDYLQRTGIALARRRSGGGAVLVSADDIIWLDVIIDRSHPRWHDDVVRSFDWLGDRIRQTLRTHGIDTDIHSGRLQQTTWSRDICFAGLGPGELVMGPDNRKLVGISQRRTRDRARFQVAILKRWSGAEHAKFLIDADPTTANELERLACGADLSADSLIESLAATL